MTPSLPSSRAKNGHPFEKNSPGVLPLLSKYIVIQIFIWTEDVDRSIEQNKSSL